MAVAGRARTSLALAGILLWVVCSAAVAADKPVRVEIFTAFDLPGMTLRVSWSDHVALLDGEVITDAVEARLTFGSRLTVKAGAAQLKGRRFELSPNQPEALFKIQGSGAPLRRYPGALRIERVSGSWRIANDLPLEAYAAAVAEAETEGRDALMLQTMAILARTRASAGGHHPQGSTCDRTCCMLYRGAASLAGQEAAKATRGQVLTYDGKLCPVYFHACCAGRTRSPEQAVPRKTPHPALQRISDLDPNRRPWCREHPHFAWRRRISKTELDGVVRAYAKARKLGRLRPPVELVRPSETAVLKIRDQRGEHEIHAEDFRMFLGRSLGWNWMLSDRFRIVTEGDDQVLEGRGFGHRLGLCQAGAAARLRAGHSVAEVLGAYFPGATISGRDTLLAPSSP